LYFFILLLSKLIGVVFPHTLFCDLLILFARGVPKFEPDREKDIFCCSFIETFWRKGKDTARFFLVSAM
jgi:hypothetical protein